MNNHARYGFPRLAPLFAGLALLGGCKTSWDRLDEEYLGGKYRPEVTLAMERTISSFRPGLTRFEDIQKSIGTLEKVGDSVGIGRQLWSRSGRGWQFDFSNDGVLRSFNRMLHTYCLAIDDEEESREFDEWFEDRLAFHPVPPGRALDFTPGTTTQEHVVSTWGPCMRAEVLSSGGFCMHWGSNQDAWALQFDPTGTLVSPPRHYGVAVGK